MNEQVQVAPSAEETRKFFFDMVVCLVGSPNTDMLPTTEILEVAATITKQALERAKQEGWV